jgi:galactonate dehydratase
MSRITAIETAIPSGIMPNLLLVRIHTEDGFIGCGETYYTPHAIAALIHDWMAERLLGADALAIESHWRFLYERCTPFGHPGAEMRALSAIDLALWDILGQACNQPVYRLLGGPVREAIPVYNTSGGPSYGALNGSHGSAASSRMAGLWRHRLQRAAARQLGFAFCRR